MWTRPRAWPDPVEMHGYVGTTKVDMLVVVPLVGSGGQERGDIHTRCDIRSTVREPDMGPGGSSSWGGVLMPAHADMLLYSAAH